MAECEDTTNGQKRCTYCFQELNEMTDPRQLPCFHIVCLPCLKNDWKLEEPQCRACSKPFGDVDMLPKIMMYIKEPDVASEQTRHSYQCDMCPELSTATKFCLDCGKKICEKHRESHHNFFGDTHKTIEIRAYADKPDYYSQAYCEDHPNNPIKHVCGKCYYIPCCYCTPGVCQTGETHRYQPLENIRAPIQAEFDDLMKKCSEKIAELCNLEKQTWRTVDDLNEKCEAMISQVEETTKQQIAEIMKKSDDLKKQIADYQGECLAKIDSYTVNLIEEVAEIEREQLQTQQFLRENHTAKIVRDRVANIDKLKSISVSVTAPFELEEQSHRTLIPADNRREIELKFAPLITLYNSLTHLYDITIPEGKYCRTLALAEETKLLVGCSEYLVMYDLTSRNTICYNSNTSRYLIQSIDFLKEQSQVYSLDWNGVVNCLPKDLSSRSVIFSEGTFKGRLCVTGKFVTMCYSSSNRVLICNTKTAVKRSYKLAEHKEGKIHSISSAPHDSILTLDGIKGIVCCYKLHENATPTLKWSCAGITGGYAICSDQHGLVYVSTDGKLYVLFEG